MIDTKQRAIDRAESLERIAIAQLEGALEAAREAADDLLRALEQRVWARSHV